MIRKYRDISDILISVALFVVKCLIWLFLGIKIQQHFAHKLIFLTLPHPSKHEIKDQRKNYNK